MFELFRLECILLISFGCTYQYYEYVRYIAVEISHTISPVLEEIIYKKPGAKKRKNANPYIFRQNVLNPYIFALLGKTSDMYS